MTINLTIPQKWNDLSEQQAKNISYILYCTQRSIINVPKQAIIVQTAAYINCAKELLRHNRFKAIRVALKELTVEAYKPFTEFIFNQIELQVFPETFALKKTLYAPAFRLRNLTIEEFSFADSLYFRFKTTNDVKYLNLLCSVLYRQKADNPSQTDIRTPYNRLLAEQNYSDFANLPIRDKIVVAFAYEGSRNHLVSLYPNVFPKSNSKPNPNQKPKYTPFGELIAAKINYDPSKLPTTNKTNIYSFFSVYENELKQIKKIPRKR